jgi:hypothetical protein
LAASNSGRAFWTGGGDLNCGNDGTVQCHRFNLEISQLELVASTQYFTSHDIDSSNVDMAIAADFNGDGISEVVMQSQDKSQLVGLQRMNIKMMGCPQFGP